MNSHWNERANEIFADAVQLRSERARRDFLEKQCGDNVELRRQVDSMMAASQDVDEFLQVPATQAYPISTSAIQIGSTIDRYRLIEEIGRGGFGYVYKAQQTDPVKRTVALKILKLGMDTDEIVARFEIERQALALMEHPNIAKVIDGGTTSDGRPYFVMELVQGAAITDYCDRKRLSIETRLDLFRDVCRAVQHAHQKGFIHRDIKPGNILVADGEGGAPVAKVIDFGVAKAIEQEYTTRTLFTAHGQVMGTLQYMSPEQANASSIDIDTRSDVYSLGVILYELLTGSTPITDERIRSSALDEMYRILREEEPSTPSSRIDPASGRTFVLADQRATKAENLFRQIRGELDWITLKCLNIDRNLRYTSPKEIAVDIERFLANEPVEAAAPSARYRASKFLARNKSLALTSGVIAVALFFAAVISSAFGWVALQRSIEANQARAELTSLTQRQRREIYALDMYRANQSRLTGGLNATRATIVKYADHDSQDLRDITWRYLWDQSRPGNTATLPNARYVAASPDGRFIAHADTQEESGEVTGVIIRSQQDPFDILHTIPGTAQRLRFSPDGSLLAGAMWNGGVTIWETETGNVVRGWNEASSPICFSPDGKHFVCQQKSLLLLDTSNWSEVEQLEVKPGPMRWSWLDDSVHFTPDGRFLVYPDGLLPRTFLFYDMESKSIDKNLSNKTGCGAALAFAPDGSQLAHSNGASNEIWIFDLPTMELRDHSLFVWSLEYSPDGRQLLSGSGDELLNVWDAGTYSLLASLPGYRTGVHTVEVSADSKFALTTTNHRTDDSLKVWPLAKLGNEEMVPGLIVGATPKGEFVTHQVDERLSRELSWWDQDLNLARTSEIDFDPSLISGTLLMNATAMSCDGKRIAFGLSNGTAVIWNTVAESTEKILAAELQANDPIHSVVWHPHNENLVAIGSASNKHCATGMFANPHR